MLNTSLTVIGLSGIEQAKHLAHYAMPKRPIKSVPGASSPPGLPYLNSSLPPLIPIHIQ